MKAIERTLNQAITDSMPDMEKLLDSILEADITPMTAPDNIVRQQPENHISSHFSAWLKDCYSSLFLKPALLFSLCLFLFVTLCSGVMLNSMYIRTDTLVAIDVNPSIELSTNKKNKVIAIDAKNKDADIILEDMELIDVDLNIAVNAIIGSMLKHGYLQDDENTILISVSNKKENKAKQIQNKIEEDFVSSLKVVDKQATFIKQAVSKDDSLEKLASELNISIGKLQFINQILELDDNFDISILADMSMNELAALAQEYEILPSDTVTTTPPAHTQNTPPKTKTQTQPADSESDTTSEEKNNRIKPNDASDSNKPGKLNDTDPDDAENGDDYDNDTDEDGDTERDTDWQDEDDDATDDSNPRAPGKLNSTRPGDSGQEDLEE